MFHGSIVALVTPFLENGAVDLQTLRTLIEWHIDEGTDAVLLCGITGEASTLSEEEQLQIFQCGVDVAQGRIPILVGTGSNDTRLAVKKTEQARDLGVDGCLVIVPYYNRPTPEGCLAHFHAVSNVGLPMIVYNHPVRTGIKLTAKTLAEISYLPNVVSIKEGSGDLELIMELSRLITTPILSGDDLLTLPIMSVGGVGVISVVANLIPSGWKEMLTLCGQNDFIAARRVLHRYHDLVKAMSVEINPQPVKFAMSLMGKCNALMRLPLVQPRKESQEIIRLALDQTVGLEI